MPTQADIILKEAESAAARDGAAATSGNGRGAHAAPEAKRETDLLKELARVKAERDEAVAITGELLQEVATLSSEVELLVKDRDELIRDQMDDIVVVSNLVHEQKVEME